MFDSVPATVRVPLAGPSDPVLVCYRPARLPHHYRATWRVFSGTTGEPLASGGIESTASTFPGGTRVTFDDVAAVPSTAFHPIEAAGARAFREWSDVLMSEKRTREYIENRRAALRAIEDRIAAAQREAEEIREQIRRVENT